MGVCRGKGGGEESAVCESRRETWWRTDAQDVTEESDSFSCRQRRREGGSCLLLDRCRFSKVEDERCLAPLFPSWRVFHVESLREGGGG